MDSRYDTYGLGATTLDEAVPRVQQLLGFKLEERDSSYYGGTYYLYKVAYDRKLKIFANHDPEQDSWVRSQYRDHVVIIEVSDLDDMDGIQRKLMNGLEGVVLLESETLSAKTSDS